MVRAHDGALGIKAGKSVLPKLINMSATRPLRLSFFLTLNVSPAWLKHSWGALPAIRSTGKRERESTAKSTSHETLSKILQGLLRDAIATTNQDPTGFKPLT